MKEGSTASAYVGGVWAGYCQDATSNLGPGGRSPQTNKVGLEASPLIREVDYCHVCFSFADGLVGPGRPPSSCST